MTKLTDSLYLLIVLGLCGASAFFTWNIYKTRAGMKTSAAGLHLTSGQKASVKKIIDGDEILVETSGRRFVIRILGVSAFDPTLNDPLDKSAGEAAVFQLEKLLLNSEIEIVFDEYKVDESDRVLAYVHRNSVDIGENLVDEGIVLVYTKYPFSRMTEYLKRQQRARDERRGLWSNPPLAQRGQDLLRLWDQERK